MCVKSAGFIIKKKEFTNILEFSTILLTKTHSAVYFLNRREN